VPWPKAVAETCRAYRKLPAEVLALTLSEFRLIRSGGEAEDREDPMPRGKEARERYMDALEEFWAEGDQKSEAGFSPSASGDDPESR
jgi:hypothetical protein